MRGKTRLVAAALLAITGVSSLAGCIVAPAPGYYYDGDRPHHRHGGDGGYHDRGPDRGYWR